MKKTILITGTSSGIGESLALHYCQEGAQVFGLSRKKPQFINDNYQHFYCDIRNKSELELSLNTIKDLCGSQLDLVILNAGVLGPIANMQATSTDKMKAITESNLWSNKDILDNLLANCAIQQVVAMSSGAAVNGNKGWGAYSISKAALNMMIKLYAAECPETHFSALAPGLVDTQMQDYLCSLDSQKDFPSLGKIQGARNTVAMPKAKDFAPSFAKFITKCKSIPSGDFRDIRKCEEVSS